MLSSIEIRTAPVILRALRQHDFDNVEDLFKRKKTDDGR
jgi:hypothetical protein